MKRLVLLALPMIFVASTALQAQDDWKEKLRKEILEAVAKMIEQEEARLLKSIQEMIKEEFAKLRGEKPKAEKPKPEKPKGRGYLGVRVAEIAEDEREQFGLEDNENGIRLTEIIPDTAAEKAGLETDDIVLAIDGKEIGDIQGLVSAIQGKGAGSKMTFKILRDGERKELEIELGLHPDDARRPPQERQPPQGGKRNIEEMLERTRKQLERQGYDKEMIDQMIARLREQLERQFGEQPREPKEDPEPEPPPKPKKPYLGILVDPLSDEEAKKAGLEPGEGLLISEVREGTPAEECGFKANDILIEIDGLGVEGEETLKDFMVGAKAGQMVEFTVLREGKTVVLKCKLGSRE
jgi:S1-C subfamily serine protease